MGRLFAIHCARRHWSLGQIRGTFLLNWTMRENDTKTFLHLENIPLSWNYSVTNMHIGYIFIIIIYIVVFVTWPVVGIFECEQGYLMQNKPGQFVPLVFLCAHVHSCLSLTYTIHCLWNATLRIVQYSKLVLIPVLTVFLCIRALIARVSLGCNRRLHERRQ